MIITLYSFLIWFYLVLPVTFFNIFCLQYSYCFCTSHNLSIYFKLAKIRLFTFSFTYGSLFSIQFYFDLFIYYSASLPSNVIGFSICTCTSTVIISTSSSFWFSYYLVIFKFLLYKKTLSYECIIKDSIVLFLSLVYYYILWFFFVIWFVYHTIYLVRLLFWN